MIFYEVKDYLLGIFDSVYLFLSSFCFVLIQVLTELPYVLTKDMSNFIMYLWNLLSGAVFVSFYGIQLRSSVSNTYNFNASVYYFDVHLCWRLSE